MPQYDGLRRVQTGRADHRRRHRLVEGGPAGSRVGADVRDAVQVEDLAESAVLAGDAVQDREDRIGWVVAQPLDQAGVDVTLLDLHADTAQRVGNAAPGAQGNVPLVRQSTCQYQHSTQITHRNFPIARGRLRRPPVPRPI